MAKILIVSEEAIKNFDEAVFNIVSNTFNDIAASVQYNFNPIEKIVALYDERMALYERMLESEKEEVEMLEKLVGKK